MTKWNLLLEYLVNGFSKGFSVSCGKQEAQLECRNLKSASAQPEIAKETLCKELLAGRMAGPFLDKPCKNFNLSPLGFCPKKEPNKFRLIFNLSYPHGNSVNDYIPQEYSSVQYTRVADAIAGIKKLKFQAFLAKTDISMAYRNLPLRPEDYHLLGFCWKNLYYFDKCLPMGCSASCQIFERFSSGLHWIGQYYMPEGLMFHILDDFLIVAPTAEKCQVYLDKF